MRKIFFTAFAVFAVFGLIVTSVLAWKEAEREQLAHEGTMGLKELGSVGEFSFSERSGKRVAKKDFEGKVWIADFIFTNCPTVCPRLSAQMAKLQKELAGVDVRFASFTVDPERDTPEKLREYADKYGADKEKWVFLTGAKEEIHRFVQDSFHLAVGDAAAKDSVLAMDITHSGKIVLVDRDARIAGYFDGSDPVAMEKLRRKAEALARK